MAADGLVQVPLALLRTLTPLDRPFWTEQAVTTDDVWEAFDSGRLRDEYVSPRDPDWKIPSTHAERVAYFIAAGPSEEDVVEIDVGAPGLGCFVQEPVQDGNHRLAAALLRGDPWAWCSICGSESEIRRRFGDRVADAVFVAEAA